jgi:hypothetical protein
MPSEACVFTLLRRAKLEAYGSRGVERNHGPVHQTADRAVVPAEEGAAREQQQYSPPQSSTIAIPVIYHGSIRVRHTVPWYAVSYYHGTVLLQYTCSMVPLVPLVPGTRRVRVPS